MERIAPSATLEAQIADVLSRGIDDNEQLAELGRLGTRLVLQRAVEDEVAAFLGRARYERVPAATGSRNGSRNKPIQTAEGEITIAMPQVRGTVERFVSRVIPDVRRVVRTRPLEALVIGAYVRGLSDRDIESLLDEAGLGHVSKNAASQVCRELRARYAAFCAKSLVDVELLALYLDAVYLPTRPSGSKEGVLVAWGYQLSGERGAAGCAPRPARVARRLDRPRSRSHPPWPAQSVVGGQRRCTRPDLRNRAGLARR
jgi:transposase-like protein